MKYTDFNSLFKSAYDHTKNTGHKMSLLRKDSPTYGKGRLIEPLSSDGRKFTIDISFVNVSSFKKIFELADNNGITFIDIINKQLLPFL